MSQANPFVIGSKSGRTVLPLLVALTLAGCGGNNSSSSDTSLCGDGIERPANWAYESHCHGVDPNYDEVFDATVVRRIDLDIDPTVFAEAQADLDSIVSTAGTNDLDAVASPMWMGATLTYNNQTWTNVGVRWKGHASMVGAWSNRIGKLSMKVRFDEFEDTYPETDDQRFFGFKGFNLSNSYKDDSFIRDKTAADIFRAAGVPAPRSSFAQLYINIGSGPFYMGIYTIIEDPEDEMLDTQLGDGSGNLYKPWGDAARWPVIADTAVTGGATTVADIESHFEKATNEDSSDWSDIIAAVNVLHADRADAATWRANLETVFDVGGFLKTLAANQTMVNWDSYGCMTHNYLVYANPSNGGKFLWMPWDLNESLAAREHDGCVPSSVLLDEIVDATDTTVVAREWPLIKYILGDSTYREQYKVDLQNVLDSAFAADSLKAQMQADHDLVAPYINGEVSTENGLVVDGLFSGAYIYQNATQAEFETSLTRVVTDGSDDNGLQVHVDNRRTAVAAALAAEATD